MMRRFTGSARVVVSILFLALLAAAVGAQLDVPQKASLELFADRTAYAPGERARVAAVVTIEKRWHVNSNTPTLEYLIPTELRLETPPGSSEPELRYPEAEMMTFAFAPDQPIAVYEGTVTIHAVFELPGNVDAGELELPAELRYQACDDRQCLPPTTTDSTLVLTIGDGGETTNETYFAVAGAGAGASGPGAVAAGGIGVGRLALMLVLGVIGGLILNAMPCVLPVLSLKVFGLMKSAERGRGHVVVGALATTAGVLASFWALAGLTVAARAAGATVGWGVHFQQPGFVAFLLLVMVLFALNMWGLFEIPLPASLARAGGGSREGIPGHFASGLFATLMATPCSAPFLGTAVGFALAQSAPVIFAVFTAVGVGLALPYIVLAAVPRAGALLPKPGEWMNTLRGVLGFLLAAAAVWLLYVLGAQIEPASLLLVELALVILAMVVWLARRVDHGLQRRAVAVAGVLVAVATIVVAADADARRDGASATTSSAHHDWQPFDEARALALAGEGRLVFVDVTADWCLTCKTNEFLVLETDVVGDAFDRHQVVTMKADWTNRDEAIARYLAKFGKSSIPFYVLYRPGGEPHVFGELLTKASVLEALTTAGSSVARR